MEESVPIPIPIPIANQKIELFLLAWTTTNFGKLQRSSAQIISFVVSEKIKQSAQSMLFNRAPFINLDA